MLMLGAMIASAPLDVLIDRFMPDDMFYYLQPARNVACTGFSSFDGIHFTNGYQPLWFLILTPIFFIFPEGGEAPVRIALFMQLVLSIMASVRLFRTLARMTNPLAAGCAMVMWVVAFQRTMLNGLETALLMFVYSLLLESYQRLTEHETMTPRRLLILGALAGAAFLARTDSLFLAAALGIQLIFTGATPRRFRFPSILPVILWYGIPLSLIVGSYLMCNLVATGHLMPVSGAAKVYHSAVARAAAIQSSGNAVHVYIDNILWAFTPSAQRGVAIGLLLPWILTFASMHPGLKTRLWLFRRLWPFLAGATASYLFYGIGFYGGFTQTQWYYGPVIFMACAGLAGASHLLDSLPVFRRFPGLSIIPFVAAAMGWLQLPVVISAVVLAIVSQVLFRDETPLSHGSTVMIRALVLAVGVLLIYTTRARFNSWLIAPLFITLACGTLIRAQLNQFAQIAIPAAMLTTACLIHGVNLAADIRRPPCYWNYHLFKGASWAHDHLPPGATIWSGSAGILGYFSGHTVVNTDGLCNSYDFLENVLKKGGLCDYYRKWDYAIDAFPAACGLAPMFPHGAFVDLPADTKPPAFADGSLTRQLAVFQMNESSALVVPITQ